MVPPRLVRSRSTAQPHIPHPFVCVPRIPGTAPFLPILPRVEPDESRRKFFLRHIRQKALETLSSASPIAATAPLTLAAGHHQTPCANATPPPLQHNTAVHGSCDQLLQSSIAVEAWQRHRRGPPAAKQHHCPGLQAWQRHCSGPPAPIQLRRRGFNGPPAPMQLRRRAASGHLLQHRSAVGEWQRHCSGPPAPMQLRRRGFSGPTAPTQLRRRGVAVASS